ncbi:MAG: hypothetical protein ORN51_14045 [Akkermansiaceae bacterium]|nr:hypothetical protein [Akkermansiaceae bacterium]
MLKHLLTTVITLLALTLGASAAEADGSAKFKDSLRAAITAKDHQKLEGLIYSEGSSPADRQRMSSLTHIPGQIVSMLGGIGVSEQRMGIGDRA